MNDILAFLAGHVFAYFTIRVIVMTARGRFFLLVGVLGVVAAEGGQSVKVRNSSGSGVNMRLRAPGYAGNVAFVWGLVVAGADGVTVSYTPAPDTIPSGSVYVDVSANSSYSPLLGTISSPSSGDGVATAFVFVWNGGIFSTNYVGTPCVTNTTFGTSDFCLEVYAVGNLSSQLILPGVEPCVTLAPGSKHCWGLTNNVPSVWRIMGPGGAETGWASKVWGAGDFIPRIDSGPQPPGGGNGGEVPRPPLDNVPNPYPQTNGLTSGEFFKGTEGIIRAVNDSANNQNVAITNALARLDIGDGTNIVNVGVTNSVVVTNSMDMGFTNILNDISTNTMVTTNFLTNLLSTNVVSSSNFVVAGVSGAMVAASNAFNSSAWAGTIDGWIDSVRSTETNQGSVSEAFGTPMTFALQLPSGNIRHANFHLLSTVNDSVFVAGVKTQLGRWMRFLRSWLLKLIPFVLWWLCVWELMRWEHGLFDSVEKMPKSLDFSVWKLLAKSVVVVVVQLVVAAVLGFIPTAIVAYSQGLMEAGGSVPSMVGHIETGAESGSEWLGAVRACFNMLAEGVPCTTLVFAAANYGAFLLYGHRLFYLCRRVALSVHPYLGAVLLMLVPSADAAQVEILNYSGTNSVWSHSSLPVTLDFPPGSHALNLEAGEWTIEGFGEGGGDYTLGVPDFEDRLVVRLQSDRTVAWSVAEAEWSWFWAGYLSGIPIWGIVAAVSIMRSTLVSSAKMVWPGSD
jgi:hypothetical protein